jgi:uncharacterized membrane protein
MKSKITLVVGGVVVVILAAAVAVVLMSRNSSAPTSEQNSHTTTTSYSPPKACEAFPLTVAQALSTGATGSDTLSTDTSTDSIVVSNCNYYDSAAKISLGLLVRGAKDAAGASTNHAQFDSLPAGSQQLSGYGDKAYWDPTFGQLNILKNNNWYILTNGQAVPSSRNIDDAKKLADRIIGAL